MDSGNPDAPWVRTIMSKLKPNVSHWDYYYYYYYYYYYSWYANAKLIKSKFLKGNTKMKICKTIIKPAVTY